MDAVLRSFDVEQPREDDMRLGFLVETDHGNCAGHFINDVGATHEEAANWIVRRQMNLLPQDARLVGVTLYVDHKPVYGRRP
jgi:hypothetical protein